MDLSVRRPTKTQTFFLNINVLREVIPVANSHPYCQMRITPASREPITILCSLYFQSPCESDPCKNGADCVPEYELNSYHCHCKLGFCGTDCEHGGISFLVFVCLFFPSAYTVHISKEQTGFLLFKASFGFVF